MSTSTLIRDTLDPLLTGGAHRGVNRSASTTKPYACFYQISAVPENGITQYLGKTRQRWQVDVFASSMEAAEGLAVGAIKTAMEAALGATLTFHMDGQFSEEGTFQYITEFTVWTD